MASKTKAAPKAAETAKAAPKKSTPKKKAPSKTNAKKRPKSEAAKAAERKALAVEQVHAEFVRDEEGSGAIVLTVDGTDHTINEQALLRLRNEINEIAVGFAR